MTKHSTLIILLFFSFSTLLHAQRRADSDTKSVQEATKLAKQAEKLWKDEKYIEAEKLYYKALSIYPLHLQLSEFAEKKMKIGDVKGANKMWNELIKTGVGLDYVCWKMSESNFKEGDVIIGLEAAKKYFDLFRDQKPESAAMITFLSATKVAFALNDRKSLIQINEVASSMKNNIGNTAKYGERVSGIYLKLIDNQFAQVLTDLEDLSEGKGNFIGARVLAKEIFPIYYILINEFDKAEKSIQELVAKNLFIKAKHFTDLTGLIALGKSNYKKAIEELTIYLGLPVFQAPDKFKYYTKRAEAYEGLKEFENAKKDYEAALIYYPDYEPALNSLARLEGRIITERLTDKIAPQIIITEPLAARGIIIEAAGNEVMIKGIATDPGGLKSVTINGEKVYSQEGGTFWGNAVLKEGSNKVTIIATDFSGNNAEKTIEVERPVGASTANAVPVKEGKNYALLIGCQNYDDNTIPSLEDPIPDAIKLKLILKNSYNFGDDNVFTLFNPERSDFKKQFLEIYEVIQPEDNLVIFYAGHGIWIDKDKKGYWMLTDAKLNDVNTWLPNKEVLDMIARVPARHTLLITDACFSGSVFRTRGLNTDMPTAIQKINEKISRVAITSGNDTEVPDKSVFMKYLVKALSENKEKYMTAQKMFINQIIEAVMTETKTEPRYGTLELAGHVGGDYIFIRK